MRINSLRTVAFIAATGFAANVCAKGVHVDSRPPKAIEDVLGCRAVPDPARRLACFDDAASALTAAIDRKDVAVADREQVRKARRSLFGFSLPTLDLFGGGDNDPADKEAQEITESVMSARQDSDGNYSIVLADGAMWHQTSGLFAVAPKRGETVTIRRAALGSYFLRVGKQPAVRARRDR